MATPVYRISVSNGKEMHVDLFDKVFVTLYAFYVQPMFADVTQSGERLLPATTFEVLYF